MNIEATRREEISIDPESIVKVYMLGNEVRVVYKENGRRNGLRRRWLVSAMSWILIPRT